MEWNLKADDYDVIVVENASKECKSLLNRGW